MVSPFQRDTLDIKKGLHTPNNTKEPRRREIAIEMKYNQYTACLPKEKKKNRVSWLLDWGSFPRPYHLTTYMLTGEYIRSMPPGASRTSMDLVSEVMGGPRYL